MLEDELESRISLARLMVARELLDNLPGELGMRTALSRGYYALFHSAQAFLLAVGDKTAGPGLKHGTVSKLVRKRFGAEAGRSYEDAMRTRRYADYEASAKFVPTVVARQMQEICDSVDRFCLEAEKFLK